MVLAVGIPGVASAEGFLSLLKEIDQKGLGTVVEEAFSEKWRETIGDGLAAADFDSAERAWEAGGHVYDIHKDSFEVIDGMLSGELSAEEGFDEIGARMKKKMVDMVESVTPEPVKTAIEKLRGAKEWGDELVEDAQWGAGKIEKAVEGGQRVYEDYFGSNATEAFEPGSDDQAILAQESSIASQGYLPPEVVEDFVSQDGIEGFEEFVDLEDSYESTVTYVTETDGGRNPSGGSGEPESREVDEQTSGVATHIDSRESSGPGGGEEGMPGSAEADFQTEVDGIVAETLDRNESMRQGSGAESNGAARGRLASATANSTGAGWSNTFSALATGTAIATDTYNRGGAPSPLLNTLPNNRSVSSTAPAATESGADGECASLPRQFDISRCSAYQACSRMQVEINLKWERDNAEALRQLDSKSRADLLRLLRLSTEGSREIASASCGDIPSILERQERIAREEAARAGYDYDEMRRSMGM